MNNIMFLMMRMGETPTWPSRVKAGVCHMAASVMMRSCPVAGSLYFHSMAPDLSSRRLTRSGFRKSMLVMTPPALVRFSA